VALRLLPCGKEQLSGLLPGLMPIFTCCLCAGLAATINILTSPGFGELVICLYLWAFGVMICMFETPLKVKNARTRCLSALASVTS